MRLNTFTINWWMFIWFGVAVYLIISNQMNWWWMLGLIMTSNTKIESTWTRR